MVKVNRKSIRLLTAWVLAAALLAVLGSDALAREPRVWGLRSPSGGTQSTSVGAQSTSASSQAHKPGTRAFSGEPDSGGGKSNPVGQLSYWEMVLLGLIPLLPGQRLP